jgi:hypothetical protein
VFCAGGNKFQVLYNNFATRMYGTEPVRVLASNVSLWMSSENNFSEDGGFLIQIDHLNLTSATKFTRAMRCQRMPQNKEEEDKCDTLNAAEVK